MNSAASSANEADVALFRAFVIAPKADGLTRLQREHPEAAERLKAAQQAWRRERQAERRSKLATLLHCTRRLYEGAGLDEIAAETGKTAQAVRRALQSRGVYFEQRAEARRLSAWVSPARVGALDALAADMGATRVEALEDLIDRALEENGAAARRALRDRIARAAK